MAEVAGQPWVLHEPVLQSMAALIGAHAAGEIGVRSRVKFGKAQQPQALEDDDDKEEEIVDAKYGGELVLKNGATVAAGAGGARASDVLYERVGSVAAVLIGGVIAKRANQVNGDCQPEGTSVEAIRRSMNALRADNQVKAALFVFDSPGGSVAGVSDLADEIAALGRVMPTAAYAEDMMASGAYWLGSQTARIDMSNTAALGSVGVYTVLYDSSKAMADRGYKVNVVKAGKDKAIGVPGAAVTEGQLSVVQDNIDAIYGAFVEHVARGRRITSAAATAMADGRVYIGSQAVERGFADAVRPISATIADLQEAASRGGGAGVGGGVVTNRTGGGQRVAANPVTGAAAVLADAGAGCGEATGGDPGMEAVMKGEVVNGAAGGTGGAAGGGDGGVVGTLDRATAQANQERIKGIAGVAKLYAGDPVAGAAINEMALKATTNESVSVEAFTTQVQSKLTELRKPSEAAAPGGQAGANVKVGAAGHLRKMGAIALAKVMGANAAARDLIISGGANADTLAYKLGFDSIAEARKELREGEQAGFHRLSIKRIAEAAVRDRGVNIDAMDDRDIFRAALHSSSDFPTLLSNAANKSVIAMQAVQQTQWRKLARKGVANDYKEAKLIDLSQLTGFDERPEGGTPKLATLSEKAGTIQIKSYSKKVALTYQMYRNDDLGAFLSINAMLGLGAEMLPENLFWAFLQTNPVYAGDSVALFNSAHGNVATPADLSSTALTAARVLMRKQTDATSGNPLDVVPKYLVVPVELEDAANELVTSDYTKGVGGSSSEQTKNIQKGRFEVVSTARLTDANGWYLWADLAYSPIEIAFLDGNESPILTEVGNGDPMQFELQADMPGIGLGVASTRGAVRNVGP